MIKDLSTFSNVTEQCDICILGGGVAGLVLAKELIATGKQVILLESGAEYYEQTTQELYTAKTDFPYLPNPQYSRLRFLGGSSNHWENNTSPFSPIDFEKREWIENSGWPIKFDEIKTYYKSAQKYCGVNDDGYDTVYWQNKLNAQDLAANSPLVESQIAKSSVPPVRFYQSLKETLLKADNLIIYTHANVTDVEFDSKSKRIVNAKANSLSGNQLTVVAEDFALCLGGLENPRMLLNFNEKWDNQLGNQHDNVGKYFMEHPTPRAAIIYPNKSRNFDFYKMKMLTNRATTSFFSLTEQALRRNKCSNIRVPLIPATEYEISEGISSGHILAKSAKELEWPDDLGTHVKNVIFDLDMVIESVYRKVFNEKFFENADEIGGYLCPIMIEQSPNKNNQVYLIEEKDPLGLKKMSINYQLSEQDKANTWKALEVMAKGFGAADIGRIRLLRERATRLWNSQLGFSNHHMGTTRMSETAKDGVVDSNLQVHGCKNLYVGGSSVFCTGGHVPPTLTICALSIRLAEHLSSKGDT